MANFKTHITTSGLLGVGYAATGHLSYGMPLQSSILAGGLCTLAGVLPDVDSDNAVILRESLAFVSIFTPMLLLDRFQQPYWTSETIVLITALSYVIIRFGGGELLRRYTVHRGMWHSIPAALVAGLIVYYLCNCADEAIRWFKAGSVMIGYVWHLLLDEVFSVDNRGRRLRFKRSFGTALKFFGNNTWANVSTYGKLIAVVALIVVNPPLTALDRHHHQTHHPDAGSRQPLTTIPPGSTSPAVPAGQQPLPPPTDQWQRVSSPQYYPPPTR